MSGYAATMPMSWAFVPEADARFQRMPRLTADCMVGHSFLRFEIINMGDFFLQFAYRLFRKDKFGTRLIPPVLALLSKDVLLSLADVCKLPLVCNGKAPRIAHIGESGVR